MAASFPWLLYGAYGFTGRLILERAVERGFKPTLAGRDPRKLEALATQFSLPWEAFPLEDQARLEACLGRHRLVLLAAGPFLRTSPPVRESCLRTRCHYLDITGELPVFEALYHLHKEAEAQGVTMVSGVGFDVVPTDCLALALKEELPDATELELFVYGVSHPSGGTVASLLGVLAETPALIRKEHELVPLPLGSGGRWESFPGKKLWVVPAPLADLVSAHRSTGIPNITCYVALPPLYGRVMRVSGALLKRALRLPGVLPLAQSLARRFVIPPDATQRARGESWVMGRVRAPSGERSMVVRTLEGYEFTAHAAVLALEAFAKNEGAIPPGCLTPAQALGKEFLYRIPGTERVGAV